MKDMILVVICVIVLMLCGCAHNANMVGVGKVFRIGGEGCNILYVNGIFSFNGVKGNAESVIETNDNDAIGNPADVKSVRAIRFRTLPQVSGYLVDLAKRDPETAKEYVKIMAKFNKAVWGEKTQEPAKESSTIAQPIDLSKIRDSVKSVFAKTLGAGGIDGDGEYKELWKDNSIAKQNELANKLLSYADDEGKMAGTGETFKATLTHYIDRLGKLEAKGKTATVNVILDRATIKDGKLTALMYRAKDSEGKYFDEECPSCVDMED